MGSPAGACGVLTIDGRVPVRRSWPTYGERPVDRDLEAERGRQTTRREHRARGFRRRAVGLHRESPRACARSAPPALHVGGARGRDVRDRVHDCAICEGRQRHLGRVRRWVRPGDAQRRHQLEERPAEADGRLRAHQPHRGVAVPRGHGVRRREPLSAGPLQAVRVQDRRLRRDLDRVAWGARGPGYRQMDIPRAATCWPRQVHRVRSPRCSRFGGLPRASSS